MDDDYCIVCAEPLEWVAYAINCGHKDACSKCVARLRFVMKDTRCLLCQQLGSAVVVTRSLGAFTPTISPQDSDSLKVPKLPPFTPFYPSFLPGTTGAADRP